MPRILFIVFVLLMNGCTATQTGQYQHKPSVVETIDAVIETVPDQYKLLTEFAVYRARDNASQMVAALEAVSGEELEGMSFLISHMPVKDLQTLTADYLIDNVKLAYQARRDMPWGPSIPNEIFLNYVLPHMNVTEKRENWRRYFYEHYADVARGKGTINATTVHLNMQAYADNGITYNIKKRVKPDQSPSETIDSQVASCTGLSIMTSDILRSVGIPARVVGTPLWHDKSGNHTWFEVWDAGEWHYIGAGEKGGYDEAWFTQAAGNPDMLNPQFRIYAASYKRTDTLFPTVWNPYADYVYATDVTEDYQK